MDKDIENIKNRIAILTLITLLCTYMGIFEKRIDLKIFWLGLISILDVLMITLINTKDELSSDTNKENK